MKKAGLKAESLTTHGKITTRHLSISFSNWLTKCTDGLKLTMKTWSSSTVIQERVVPAQLAHVFSCILDYMTISLIAPNCSVQEGSQIIKALANLVKSASSIILRPISRELLSSHRRSRRSRKFK